MVDGSATTNRVSPPHHRERPEPVNKDGRRTGMLSRSGLTDGDTHVKEVPVMSRKRRTHLRGKRGQAFADKIKFAKVVAVDKSKRTVVISVK